MSDFQKPSEFELPVVVYTTPWCPYCHTAKHLLRHRNTEFAEVSVAGNSEARRWLAQTSGQTTVPQVFIHGRSIGGFDELSSLDARGELTSMLAGS